VANLAGNPGEKQLKGIRMGIDRVDFPAATEKLQRVAALAAAQINSEGWSARG
jgi:hypothetical protein